MQSKWMAASSCLAAALALGVAACGGDDNGGGSSGGGGGGSSASKTVTVYSSLPLQGASRVQTQAVNNGAKLALEQANGKAGNITVKFVPLDDSTAQAGSWTPEAESGNARKAAQDKSTAFYLGTFNSGAAAIAIPILNEAGVPMISPANTAVGLTTNQPGSNPGEPDKYYPTGTRNYTRIVPKDTIQGAALATLMKQDGCTKVQMTNDKEVYGAGLGKNVELAAKTAGLSIISNEAIDKNAANYRSLAQKAKAAGADCFIYTGITANNAVQLYKDFAAALPNAKLYGPDGVAESGFATPKDGGIPTSLDPRVKVTVATLSPDEYPPDGQAFFKDYSTKYGENNPDPYAIYGYEAMKLGLDAIARSKTGDKADILKALFATKDRQSVLGTYSIDENGDTTLTDYGVYGIKDGELTFDQTIKAKTQ
ncbi:branched-chain amino acid ABC transporter substrate-binding protein [Candidatus Solirubrobacter pratensis]|uniref:branched-chain amino acid ABC transporter substrate-binding protein n=1 Tax=Candidatus Solirubrobacter pratensis TaxID=1298857 RepID=UPI0018C99DDB|nr:branched-chain amino acid ABC transporter substrate-binding protein [Candidatus Solirubrobacter pratensis]